MRVLITGGAGFIGSNAAHHFIGRGDQVTIFDDLLRRGSQHSLAWLPTLYSQVAPWCKAGSGPSLKSLLRSVTLSVAETPSA